MNTIIKTYNDLYFPSYYLLLKQKREKSNVEWYLYDPHSCCSISRVSAGLAKDMIDNKRVVFLTKDINLDRTYYTKRDGLDKVVF